MAASLTHPMKEQILFLGEIQSNCHSEGAKRLKNPYSDSVGIDLRDTSALFHVASV